MLNLDVAKEKTIYEEMVEANKTMTGTNFSIAMRDKETGKVKLYKRVNQPCYGELRTYGEKSTRPKDHRPGDLRNPFPNGTPESVGIGLRYVGVSLDSAYWSFLLSDNSPWRRGLGGSENVEITRDKEGVPTGILLKDTEIDPTVLVNLLIWQRSYHWVVTVQEFDQFLKEGMTPFEAFTLLGLMSRDSNKSAPSYDVVGTNTYVIAQDFDLERFREGNPRDLTGGTLKDRFAYNRPEISLIWKSEEKEKNFSFAKEMSLRLKIKNSPRKVTNEELKVAAKDVFKVKLPKKG